MRGRGGKIPGALLAVLWLFLSSAALVLWPVDVLEIHQMIPARQQSPRLSENGAEDRKIFSALMPLGKEYETGIIHSVQLTPVIDRYRVQEGRIWGWQERIMSHNAGLPSLKPERGNFRHEAPWMILEGGGHSWRAIHYRVGTKDLGANVFCFADQECIELWRAFPGQLLRFNAQTVPFCLAVCTRTNGFRIFSQ